MKFISAITLPAVLLSILLLSNLSGNSQSAAPAKDSSPIFGFRNPAGQRALESRFIAVPDPKLAEEHLRILTQAPHMAGTAEDKATADYVAQKFREAGLETEVVEYRVWMNYPAEISVDVTAPPGVTMHGPTRERVSDDPYQDDARVVMPFNSMSASGDVEAEVVYANYGSPDDFQKLAQMKIDVRGKIVLVRYGQNFRGVKAFVAQEHGAAGVLIYSDPADDGWRLGDKYPQGPWRPDTGVQRGSVGYMFQFPGDPTTPGIASVPSLPDSQRTPPAQSAQLPKIPVTPISYADAWPILEHLAGPDSPREWQGSLPFTYHVGPGSTKVKMHLKQDYQFRTIWDVVGRIRGSELPDEWVVAGNHRDAWVYGAVDPSSGTAAMLESVHGIGELLKSGWKAKRSIVIGSWDAEEEGLIGSTEWGEQHESELANAVAYFNMDVAVSGPKFGASSVPTLKQFIRDVTIAVPSPKGGTVYDEWRKSSQPGSDGDRRPTQDIGNTNRSPAAQGPSGVPVGDLGSGSDYTVFLQHLGVPSSDVSSSGSYGVYHSAFDNFNWFKKFGDPDFVYEQQMARVFGIEVVRMSEADGLPYDYEQYGKEIGSYVETARMKSEVAFGSQSPSFSEAARAAHRFEQAGAKIRRKQEKPGNDAAALNQALRQAERALLIPDGLPNRPWFRHVIYAPGQYTGYAAVVIPGVNESIDKHDPERTRQQVAVLVAALNRAAKVLEDYPLMSAGNTVEQILKTLPSAAGATFLALFPIVNPFGGVPLFFSLTSDFSDRERNRTALKTAMYVFAILVVFMFFGRFVLNFFGISLPVLQIAGGLIVANSAWGMVTASTRITPAERDEASTKQDISLTPMAMPLLSGPGSIGVVMGLAANSESMVTYFGIVIGIAALALSVYLFLRLGGPLVAKLGPGAVGGITRIFGFLIFAVAVQLVWDGVAQFGK